MSIIDYKLVPLIERQDLGEKCIDLLNEEWPRSYAARENSQKKSCRPSPPMSFLLVDNGDELVGHARICLLPNRPAGIWVESVIVSRAQRGKGLGKLLMQLLEDACRDLSFAEAYLSTEDKVEFYRHCGYEECDPILHSTSATSVFPVFEHLAPLPVTITPKCHSTIAINGVNCTAPPPPPPPPMICKVAPGSKSISTIDHQYMKKIL